MKTTRPAKNTVTPVDMTSEYATYAEAEAARKAKPEPKPEYRYTFLDSFKGREG